ncbi:hypothetical protein UFOVP706_44 [uncultured Caudovirales phage]|uniref:Uncharacterized protein n=1 Tax=uncultured Caudovirales phage TaxID=2100421 RepID=A0A6J5NP87_9CAUD|nr:hypothetical protein UFOVP706_44 [uncultured Caudovirales phage]
MKIDDLVKALRAGLNKATPGDWQVTEWRHGYKDGTRFHVERTVSTRWVHPQLGSPVDIARLKIGIGMDGCPPVQMIHMSEEDAKHIALCSPDNIEMLLDEIDRLHKELGNQT